MIVHIKYSTGHTEMYNITYSDCQNCRRWLEHCRPWKLAQKPYQSNCKKTSFSTTILL